MPSHITSSATVAPTPGSQPLDPLVPVLMHAHIRSWPLHLEGGRAVYMPVARAMQCATWTDGHFGAYSVPSVSRRLSTGAVALTPGGVPVALLVIDVDCEKAHKASGGTGAVPAPDAWWTAEIPKIQALLAAHPGGFVYRTRGGYRIVFVLLNPFLLQDAKTDPDRWKMAYCTWLAYVSRRFGIDGDPSCRDWTRLYRLPHATRETNSPPEERETIGDPGAIGTWACDPSPEDTAKGRKVAFPRGERKAGRPMSHRNPGVSTHGTGVLFQAFKARGWVGREIGPGKWAVVCPWGSAHEHGRPLDTSTVLFAPADDQEVGVFHCSHSHCSSRRNRDVITFFGPDEIRRARRAAGFPARPRKTSRLVKVDAAWLERYGG